MGGRDPIVRRRRLRSRVVAMAALALATSGAPTALADIGDVDPTFGHYGTHKVKKLREVSAVAVSPRGPVVIVGKDRLGTVVLGTRSTEGDPQRAFGNHGFAQVPGMEEVSAVSVTPGQGILVLGRGVSGTQLSKFDSEGDLDADFGLSLIHI